MAEPRRPQAARWRAERWGRRAEWLAALWLMARGYRLLARRCQTPVGEIDLVMRRGDTLAFVEVKARATLDSGFMALHAGQARRCAAAARWLAPRWGWPGACLRLDAVVIRPWRWPVHLVGVWRDDW